MCVKITFMSRGFFSHVGEFGGNYYYHIIYMDLFAISRKYLFAFWQFFIDILVALTCFVAQCLEI